MRRPDFITLFGSAALAAPMPARSQSGARRLGLLMMYSETNIEPRSWVEALRSGLQQLGWLEGRNLRTDSRWTGNLDAIGRAAKELVGLQPDLIFSSSTPTTAALLKETRSIPIVFGNIVDPVGSGFVSSLARPGGNVTGFVNFEATMGGKFLELLKEVSPGIKRATMVYHPSTAPYAHIYLGPFKTAAAALGIEPVVAPARNMTELASVIAAQGSEPNALTAVPPDGYWIARTAEVAALATRYRLPTVFYSRSFAADGCLISYGNDIRDNYARAAAYVDRILKGAKPSELPVQFPVKFQLIVNLKTAKTLGLEVPLILQQRADEVIE